MEGARAFADAGAQLFHGRHFAVEISFEELLVFLDRHFDELQVHLLRLFSHLRREVGIIELRAELFFVPNDGFHLNEIDHALEIGFGADRQLYNERPRAEAIDHHLHAAREIRTHSVHLVHEADARNAVPVGLPPHRFRLRLYTGDRVEHRNRTVEHAHGALDLDREIDVARRIDDVDAVIVPEAGRRRRGDGNPTFLLLLHKVHGGGAVMHFADLMALAGVIKDALGRGRLAGVDMGADADVAIAIKRCGTGHCADS